MFMGEVDNEMSPGTGRVGAFWSLAAKGKEDSAKEVKKKLIEQKHVLSCQMKRMFQGGQCSQLCQG